MPPLRSMTWKDGSLDMIVTGEVPTAALLSHQTWANLTTMNHLLIFYHHQGIGVLLQLYGLPVPCHGDPLWC